jgi:transposase
MHPASATKYAATTRGRYWDKFKTTFAPEALRVEKATQEIAAKHKIHPTQMTP